MATQPVQHVFATARAEGRAALDERSAKAVVSHFGIAIPRSTVLTDDGEIEDACKTLTPPFVVKVMSPDILHKSDVGGVRVGLANADEVAAAVADMRAGLASVTERFDGFLLEEMVPSGLELVVGGVVDPQFGPMVMVGLGGVFVEVLGDVAFRICPINEQDALEMLHELAAYPLVAGVRGRRGVSAEAIAQTLLRVGGEHGLLMDLASDVSELDINPLIVSDEAAHAADARIVLRETGTPGSTRSGRTNPTEELRALFEPRTVAVVGASAKGNGPGNAYIRNIRDFGFDGPIYPIHPTADLIEGLPAYRSLADTPEHVDYAYVAVGSEMVPGVLEAAAGHVSFAQVMSSGFGEVEGGDERQERLLEAARRGGMRLLGPNCLGTHSPRGHLTFIDRAPGGLGPVGVVAQSGGLGVDLLRSSERRGLRFSGLVTVGNSADIGPSDLIDFFTADPATEVIGLYLEGTKEGRRLFEQLRANAAAKPVVILKGGRTQQGQRAAASHTGALAGDDRAWEALAKQTGSVLVEDLEQFVDVLLAFQTLDLRPGSPTEDVVLFGNGGGTSVLATDSLDRRGFALTAFPPETLRALEDLRLPPGTSVVNPIDAPAGSLAADDGRVAHAILSAILIRQYPGAIVMHLNLPVLISNTDPAADVPGNLVAAALRAYVEHAGKTHLILVLRSDGEPSVEERKRSYRTASHDVGVPVFDTLTQAAEALSAVRTVERFRAAQRGPAPAGATPAHEPDRRNDQSVR